MKRSALRFVLLSAAGIAATTAPLLAATDATPVAYAITSTIEQPGGRLVSTEVLTVLGGSDGRATVTLAQARTGQLATLTANVDEHGVIGVLTTDPALTCYNTLQGLLATAGDATASSGVQVAFGGSAVAIPLRVSSQALADGTNAVTIGGLVAGTLNAQPGNAIALVVDGNAITRGQSLLGARLRETSVLVATHAALAQSTCTISRLVTQAPAQRT